MNRYQNLMIGLTRTVVDEDLIRYAATLASLGTVNEIRFVHVMPDSSGHSVVAEHDSITAELREAVNPHFSNVPTTIKVHFDLLAGPLIDQLLGPPAPGPSSRPSNHYGPSIGHEGPVLCLDGATRQIRSAAPHSCTNRFFRSLR